MREIWQAVLTTSGARVYGLLLGIVSLMLTARWLGPEGRGTLAAVTTWVGLFSTFGYLSLGQVAIHRATQRQQEAWLGPVLGSLGLLSVIITILGWGVAAILYFSSEGKVFGNIQSAVLFTGFISLPFMVWEQYSSSLLMALDRINIYNRYQIIGSTFGLVALFVMLPALHWGVVGAILAAIIGQFIISSGGLRFLLKRAGDTLAISKDEIHSLLKGGVKLHLNAIGTVLFTSVDILMLNHYRGAQETGYYQLSVQLMGTMMILPQAASMVLYGKVATLGPDVAWRHQKRLILQIMGLMVLMSLVAYALAPLLIKLFAGTAFTPSIQIFRWLLLGLIGMSFSTLLASQWIGRGYFWQASLLTLIVGFCNLGANAIFIPRYGMIGAVWAFLGTYTFAILANGLMAVHCSREARHNKELGICT